MVQYLLEGIGFQLIFLMLYDLMLKRETFFQWNRFYLLGTFTLSLILPLIHIEAFQTVLPLYGNALASGWALDPLTLSASAAQSRDYDFPWLSVIGLAGMCAAVGFFLYKLLYLRSLRQQGQLRRFNKFCLILLPATDIAFSFFRSIYMGDSIPQKNRSGIIKHELVHIGQWHTLDLLFFEILRIPLWFNPLVYLFQARISEVHEFTADARVAESDRRGHYQELLKQVFQTESLSFINLFYKSTLIKKRIIMLNKSKSHRIRQVKYFLLLPLISGMLLYSSCQQETSYEDSDTISVGRIDQLTPEEENLIVGRITTLSDQRDETFVVVSDGTSTLVFSQAEAGSYITGPNNMRLNAKMEIITGEVEGDFNLFGTALPESGPMELPSDMVPFGLIEKVPVYPGCEDASDQRSCFNDKIMEHVRKNFRYPREAIDQKIQGRVNVMFTIDKTGAITSIKKRGPHPLLEGEVDRIISLLPEMIPGEQAGKPVNVPFSLPVTFALN